MRSVAWHYPLMIPYWDTVEATSKAHAFFEVAGIVILILLAVAELAAWKYGRRRDELINQSASAQAAKVQTLQTELSDAQKKIQPRHLSAEQMPLIVASIRQAGWQKAEIIWVGNGEPEFYARSLATAFEQAGVSVHMHTLGPFIPSAWGLLVVQTTNDDASKLKALLDAAGVKSEIALTNDTLGAKNQPTLVVGSRDDM
jgi:glycine/D-amino acid oxidase-like deaminating enzyme